MEKLKKELTELILKLTDIEYRHFCTNYHIIDFEEDCYFIIDSRNLLQFINDLQDEEEIAEVISEIYFNTETDY